jgi:large subunit ribosomal protein L23
MSKTIVLQPRLNEKTYGLAASRVYVFDVDRSVNKHSIARAVEDQFDVKVTEVNTANISGKPKRIMSLSGKRLRNANGSRSDFKKAYVTLAEGNALPFFDAIEEEEQKEQAAQEQFDKAAAKQAEKEEKAEAKAAKKSTKSAKPAAKPKAKAADEAKKPEEAAEEETKHGLAAWRGFRLRKKNKGDK